MHGRGSGAMDTFDPGGVAYDDSSRVSLRLQTCGLAVRTRPLPGSEKRHSLSGGSELTLATTGYRARPLRGRTLIFGTLHLVSRPAKNRQYVTKRRAGSPTRPPGRT